MENPADLFQRFEQLNAIGAALSNERNIDRLLERILLAAKAITHADGGTLYLFNEARTFLRFVIVRTDSLSVAFGGTTGAPISAKFKDLPLYQEDGQPNNSLVAAYAALHVETVNIADAYSAEGFDFSGTKKFDQATGYRSRSFLTVPMKDHENEVIGVLQLLNAIDPISGEPTVFSDADQRLAESLASQAAVALNNHLLVNQLEALFESFIKLINMAIDEKSPYTGGHCQRVPILAMLLAEALNADQEGPLAGFQMDERDLYELKIAALLHDCGKITTPVHVVDKATKLQTLFDRIHLISTRFEVVRRDAEIAMLRAILAGADRAEAELRFQKACAMLEADRAFLRRINIGNEAMQEEEQERVRRISATWRWSDDSGPSSDFLTDNEIENLTIRVGTLTAEEREIINHHVVATIKMLESLPWPKHLKNVTEFAGGHHERMDGKGYPNGLTRGEMSLQARIMGIADIFEALTARDRPYKPAMKISHALKIMEDLSRNGHIDPDLYEVFVREKVYWQYAEQYLEPEQIDEPEEGLSSSQ